MQTGVRDIDGETIGHLIEEQQLSSPIPRATVLIQAIEHDLWPETATVALDWVDAFNGEHLSERRESTTPDVWMSRFAPELQQAASQVRGEGVQACTNRRRASARHSDLRRDGVQRRQRFSGRRPRPIR